MNPKQLRQLIKEVIREVESDSEEGSTFSPSQLKSKTPFSSKKDSDNPNDSILKLKLGGINKNNAAAVREFIAKVAYEAKMSHLEIIHAELEKDGKTKLDVSDSDIERQVKKPAQGGSADKPLPKGWTKQPPDASTWNKMNDKDRDAYIVPGSHSDEWQAATDKDVANAKKKPSKITKDTPMYNFGREGKLPKDTSLWTDNDWKTWERLHPTQKKQVQFNIPRWTPES